MSRSMTPQEILQTSENLTFNTNELFSFYFQDPKGNIYPMFTPDEIEAQKRYPNFAVSFSMFTQLWKDIPEPRREKLFNKMEALVMNLKVMDKLNDFRACPKEAMKWYLGELDQNFYYNEENDEKFYEWIISHVETES